jgi:hypothetical protein
MAKFLYGNSRPFPFDENKQLKNMLHVLVIGETNSRTTSGLRYFSTLDGTFCKAVTKV